MAPARRVPARIASEKIPPAKIVATCLALADRNGWPYVRLYDVARRMKVDLASIRRQFRDADAIGDAWLRDAELAMLAAGSAAGLAHRPAAKRLEQSLMAFLDTLAAHKPATAGIFRAKLYPGHPHHNIGLVLWVSRTVQWWREAAHLDNDIGGKMLGDLRRRIEEIGLTGIFLATLAFWMSDSSARHSATQAFLAKRLADAEAIMERGWPKAGPDARPDTARPNNARSAKSRFKRKGFKRKSGRKLL